MDASLGVHHTMDNWEHENRPALIIHKSNSDAVAVAEHHVTFQQKAK